MARVNQWAFFFTLCLAYSRLISESMISSLASPMSFFACPSHVFSGSVITSLMALM